MSRLGPPRGKTRPRFLSPYPGLSAFFLFLLIVIPLGPLTHSACAQVTLTWDAPINEPRLVGYQVCYGTQSWVQGGVLNENPFECVDVGNVTSYTISGLQPGTMYYFAVQAYGYDGDPSYSNEVQGIYTVTANNNASAGGGGGGGSGCFIATAAYGSYLDPHVALLRSFRDRFLVTHRLGRSLVSWYYAASPALADVIRRSGALRAGTRIALVPLVGFSYLCLTRGFMPGLLLALASVVFLAGLAWGAGKCAAHLRRWR